MSAETPLNLFQKLIPSTPSEAVASDPIARPKLIVKLVIAQFISSFLDKRGLNRAYLTRTCPAVSMYDAGQRADMQDQTERRIQIARMFKSLRGDLPAVLITDAGLRVQPVGLGTYDGITRDPATGKNILRITNKGVMDVSLYIGSMDQTTTDDLCSALAMVFGPLRRLGGGDFLPISNTVDGTYATGRIVLPATELSIPPASPTPLGDDPTESIYASSIELSGVDFEASMYYQYDQMTQIKKWLRGFYANEDDVNFPNLDNVADASNLREIISPSFVPVPAIRLGQNVTVMVRNRPVGSKLYVADPNIAMMSGDTLVSRRVGTTVLRLVDGGPVNDASRVLAETEISVEYA